MINNIKTKNNKTKDFFSYQNINNFNYLSNNIFIFVFQNIIISEIQRIMGSNCNVNNESSIFSNMVFIR